VLDRLLCESESREQESRGEEQRAHGEHYALFREPAKLRCCRRSGVDSGLRKNASVR
jgi:hypothetical protein